MTQKPSMCRMVIMGGIDPTMNNGATEAPAVITRVWSDDLVNVMVMTDAGRVFSKTSVPLFATPEDYAREAEAGRPMGCYWPPRV